MSGDFSRLLPHRGPALLLREVVQVDDSSATVRARFGAESPYVHDGCVPSIVTLDVAAQAAAVLEAQDGEPVEGLLVRIREAHIETAKFAAGSQVSVHTDRLSRRPPLYSYRATSRVGKRQLASFEFSLVVGSQSTDSAAPARAGGTQTTDGDTRG